MIIRREQLNDRLLSIDEPYFLEVGFRKPLMNFHDVIIAISIRFPFSESDGLHRNYDRGEALLDMLREASFKKYLFQAQTSSRTRPHIFN